MTKDRRPRTKGQRDHGPRDGNTRAGSMEPGARRQEQNQGGSGREATREPHVNRQPGIRAIAMATDDYRAVVRQGKMHDGRCGFEVGVRDLVERNPTNNAGDLGAEQAAPAVVPDSCRDCRVRSNHIISACVSFRWKWDCGTLGRWDAGTQGPRTKDHGPWTVDREPWTKDQRPKTKD